MLGTNEVREEGHRELMTILEATMGCLHKSTTQDLPLLRTVEEQSRTRWGPLGCLKQGTRVFQLVIGCTNNGRPSLQPVATRSLQDVVPSMAMMGKDPCQACNPPNVVRLIVGTMRGLLLVAGLA